MQPTRNFILGKGNRFSSKIIRSNLTWIRFQQVGIYDSWNIFTFLLYIFLRIIHYLYDHILEYPHEFYLCRFRFESVLWVSTCDTLLLWIKKWFNSNAYVICMKDMRSKESHLETQIIKFKVKAKGLCYILVLFWESEEGFLCHETPI